MELRYVRKEEEPMRPSRGTSSKALRPGSVVHSRSCQFLCFLREASGTYLREGEREASVHGLCGVPRRGKFMETKRRIEVTRGWGQEAKEGYSLRVQHFYWG